MMNKLIYKLKQDKLNFLVILKILLKLLKVLVTLTVYLNTNQFLINKIEKEYYQELLKMLE